MIHNFTMTGAIILSAILGWRHPEELCFDLERPKMSKRLKARAVLLFLMGVVVMLLALMSPDAKAIETFHSMSTVGFKVFWACIMGCLIIVYGASQLWVYDMTIKLRRFIKKVK